MAPMPRTARLVDRQVDLGEAVRPQGDQGRSWAKILKSELGLMCVFSLFVECSNISGAPNAKQS